MHLDKILSHVGGSIGQEVEGNHYDFIFSLCSRL